MIKVNLYVGKKPFRMPVILGVDLAVLPIKGLIIVWILSFLPDYILKPIWDKEIADIQSVNTNLQTNIQDLNQKLKQFDDIQAEIDLLARKEQALENKLVLVKELLKKKKNPMQIMLYIAKNIPEDLWLTKLSITGTDIIIQGESRTYKSIGAFVEGLKSSVFFDPKISIIQSQTVTDTVSGVRKEVFELKGTIINFG